MPVSQKALADKLFPVVADAEEVELRNVPPEQRRLHTETADLTVSSIHQYMANAKIEIPEFQRGYVWNRNQASRLIESLIIQCPIPVVYFSQSSDNKLVVIDGNQRLSSIKLFTNDGFELQGLTTYPELIGFSWSQLDPRFRDHINNRTIRCITILKDTHPQIKFDVFERLNTGSVKLNAQELRHGVNHGTLMKSVDELTKQAKWRNLLGLRKDTRMKGAELVLRFFAFKEQRGAYQKPLSSFLDAFTTDHRNVEKATIVAWERQFTSAIDDIAHAFGDLAFRLFDEHLRPSTSFNSALYDAQMVGFALTRNKLFRSRAFKVEKFRRAAAKLFSDERFLNSIRQATSDEQAVKTRIDRYIAFLDGYKDAV